MKTCRKYLKMHWRSDGNIFRRGSAPSYIPELAKADKNHLGVCIRTRGMETFSAGDTKERFTIQSISKVITLMVALQHCGFNKVFEKMNMEPSGERVQLSGKAGSYQRQAF